MVERSLSWEFLLIALIMTGTIMAGIFYIGTVLSDQKVASIQGDLQRFAVEQDAQEMSRRIARELPGDNCRALTIAVEQTADAVQDLQDTVATYEKARKLSNEQFTVVKKRYTNLLLERWLTTNAVEDACGRSTVSILYFYEDPERCPACEDQGIVLTDVLQERDDFISFPLDTGLDMQPVNMLLEAYNVSTYPTLVVEGDVYRGLQDRDDVDRIVESHLNATEAGPG